MSQANQFLRAAQKYEKPMVGFLREMVAIPSESAEEGPVIARIRQEMEAVGAFDKIWTDGLGNLLGQIGKPGRGKKLIAIDAHVDTVGVGERSEWKHDPYQGKLADGKVWGRGAGDQEGAIAAMVYAAKIIRDLKLPLDEYSLLMTFTVMEEDCDGLCWQYIVNEGKIRPDVVVVTDSTDCKILRGQRGRMEIGVTCLGRSCHGSMPEKGDNAVYKIARIVREIEALNERLQGDDFLGKATIAVTYIDCKTPSVCAVPAQAYIHLDRRLTVGDTKQSAVAQVKEVIKRAGVQAKVEVLRYSRPSYTGLVYETEKYFPMWHETEDSLPVQAAVRTHHEVLGKPPTVHRWTFSTNAVSIAGMFGIPCVGFGPAPESVAHTVNDSVPIEHLVNCAAFYAAFGQTYCDQAAGRGNDKPLKFKRVK
ncbi:MAG TPA: YgeY family selenium metabolism-linked hydrolase [Lacipirellulaceae bacterium]|nr:YgeY family selenium metabolism-linked hydrolase [Lacipirellulaceae bacterium]